MYAPVETSIYRVSKDKTISMTVDLSRPETLFGRNKKPITDRQSIIGGEPAGNRTQSEGTGILYFIH